MTPLDRYTCEEMFQRLDDYLDRALSPEEQRMIEEHLKDCEECAGEYRFEQTVISDIRSKLKRIEIPADLAARISEMLAAPDDKNA